MKKTKITIWISGVTASGKTTLGKELFKNLKKLSHLDFTFLDGEDLRKKLKKNYGHTLEERFELIKEYIAFTNEEHRKGKSVILSTVSHKRKMRKLARNLLSHNFFEVNLICSAESCSKRDFKNVYNKVTKNSKECLPGVTEPYEVSSNPELIINTEENSIQECNRILLENVMTYLNCG